MIAENGAVKLAYDVEGSGPDLVLIAGVASTRPIWSLVRPALARHFRTIAFDPRDSGNSTIAAEPYGLPELAADVEAVMDAAESPRAHVLGHSLGGVVAQEFGLSRPERVRTLTLVSTWARGDVYGANVLHLMQALTQSVADDRTLLAAIIFAGLGETTLQTSDLFAMTDAAMALGPLAPRAAIARQWELAAAADTSPRVSQLSMPVHVMWGMQDRLVPPWLSQEVARTVPHARSTPLENCGHVAMVAAPEAFTRAVIAFCAQR